MTIRTNVSKYKVIGASAETDVSKTADVTLGTGNSITGVSATELDSSDIGTGANLRINSFSTKNGRNKVGDNNIVYNVTINEHKFK